MGRIIYNETERLLDWAAAHYTDAAVDGDTHAMGREVDGELVAVTLYNNFTQVNCNMHVVSDGKGRWLNREFLAHAFAYPFIQLGLNRVTAMVPAKNTAALTLDLRLGFQMEGRMPEAMPGDDVVILGMLKRKCIWIPEGFTNGR